MNFQYFSILDDVFLIEIESGLHKNYVNETTFDELCQMVYLYGSVHLGLYGTGMEIAKKPWHESIWVRDLINVFSTLKKSDFLSILSLCSLAY